MILFLDFDPVLHPRAGTGSCELLASLGLFQSEYVQTDLIARCDQNTAPPADLDL